MREENFKMNVSNGEEKKVKQKLMKEIFSAFTIPNTNEKAN